MEHKNHHPVAPVPWSTTLHSIFQNWGAHICSCLTDATRCRVLSCVVFRGNEKTNSHMLLIVTNTDCNVIAQWPRGKRIYTTII